MLQPVRTEVLISDERSDAVPAARSLLLVLALVPATVAAGCGGGGGGSDEDQITKVTRDFVADVKAGHWDDVCDSLSAAGTKQIAQTGALLGETDCPKIVAKAFAISDDDAYDKVDPDGIQLKNLKIDGDHATAETVPSMGDDPISRYVKEDGHWKVDADPEEGDNSSTTSESSPDPAPVPEKAPSLSAGDRGFTKLGYDAAYGAIVHNPGPADAVGVAVKVDAIGAKGQVLGTETNNLTGVSAGADFGVAGRVDTDNKPISKLKITITVDHGEKAGSIVLPKVSGVRLRQADDGTEVRAQVTNTLDKDISPFSTAYAVLRDGSGRIVGGLTGNLTSNHLDAGDRGSVLIGGDHGFTGFGDPLVIKAKTVDVYFDAEPLAAP